MYVLFITFKFFSAFLFLSLFIINKNILSAELIAERESI